LISRDKIVILYMKYAVNAGSISSFVVGGATSERDPPVAVIRMQRFDGVVKNSIYTMVSSSQDGG